MPVKQEGSETRLVLRSQTNFVQPHDLRSSLYYPFGFIINLAGRYPWAVHVILDTRLPPTFCAFISGGRREPGDEVMFAHDHGGHS